MRPALVACLCLLGTSVNAGHPSSVNAGHPSSAPAGPVACTKPQTKCGAGCCGSPNWCSPDGICKLRCATATDPAHTSVYDPAKECCTRIGIQLKDKMTNPSACEKRVKRPDFPGSKPNGCGTAETRVQDSFKELCDKHDTCYDDCSKTKEACDTAMVDASLKLCQKAYKGAAQTECTEHVHSFYGVGLTLAANEAYKNAQNKACYCCQ